MSVNPSEAKVVPQTPKRFLLILFWSDFFFFLVQNLLQYLILENYKTKKKCSRQILFFSQLSILLMWFEDREADKARRERRLMERDKNNTCCIRYKTDTD